MKPITSFSGVLFILIFTAHLAFGQELTILHTNDMHSKLTGYGPESEYSPMVINNDSTQGGFARLTTLFNQTREKSPNSTLIVDAGDFLMGTLFHAGEAETGFQLNLMKKMGYDYITLGNHEFEFGPVTLAKILNAAEKKGGFPQIVASNIKFSKESADDDELEAFQTRKLIKDYVVFEKNGLKIGLIGLLGKDAVSVAPATKPVQFVDYIKAASKLANYLKKNEKVDIVIALSHSGIYPDKESKGYVGEDIDLARKVPAIDIILSGHTHVKTPEYIKIGTTYILQTGSYVSNLGKINLKYKDGEIVDFRFELIPVNDQIVGDKIVNREIEEYTHFIEQKYLAPVNLTYKEVIGQTDFDLKIDFSKLNSSNIGPFIADASKYYIEKTGNQVDFSIVASGTIREDFEKGIKGILTVPDAFRVMSLGEGYDGVPGYPLARIYITGKEVKKLMEIVVMSRPKGGDGFLYLSGIKTTINSKKGFLNKVQKVAINGNEIDISKKNTQLYSIAANTYLLSFIGRIKKMSHGLVKIVPKDINGQPVTNMKNQLIDINPDVAGVQEAKEWIALIEYMKSFQNNENGIPLIPENYKKGDHALIDLAQ